MHDTASAADGASVNTTTSTGEQKGPRLCPGDATHGEDHWRYGQTKPLGCTANTFFPPRPLASIAFRGTLHQAKKKMLSPTCLHPPTRHAPLLQDTQTGVEDAPPGHGRAETVFGLRGASRPPASTNLEEERRALSQGDACQPVRWRRRPAGRTDRDTETACPAFLPPFRGATHGGRVGLDLALPAGERVWAA